MTYKPKELTEDYLQACEERMKNVPTQELYDTINLCREWAALTRKLIGTARNEGDKGNREARDLYLSLADGQEDEARIMFEIAKRRAERGEP